MENNSSRGGAPLLRKEESLRKRMLVNSGQIIEAIKSHDIWELGPLFPAVAKRRFKGKGKSIYAPCAFHLHPDVKPSFSWHLSKNFCQCYGCGMGGDLIGFYSAMTGKDFIPSVIALARFFHIKLQFGNRLEKEGEEEWQ